MFKIAKLAAFSRKNISKNARSLDTVDKNCTLDKIVHYGQKLDTVEKNCTLRKKIGHCEQTIGHSENNWTMRTKMYTVDKKWTMWTKIGDCG